jgi:hypothetical protein
MCGWNAGLLAPYFFPKFTTNEMGKWVPLSMMDRPFALAFFELQVGGSVTIRAGRQVGKSTTLVARQRMYADILSGFASLYIVPHTQYLNSYAERFRAMDKKFRFPIIDKDTYKQNKYFKEYPRGNTIRMIRTGESPDDARSLSADEDIFDESQHMDPEFEVVIDQTLKASKIAARYYAGTSLTTDTFLEAKYQEGSKGTWHVPTKNNAGGREWVNCGNAEEILECIKPEGLISPYDGTPLRVEDGEYVHEELDAHDRGLISFHTPQIIVPEFVNQIDKWYNEIYSFYKNKNLSQFLQEVMGIPQDDGHREISLEDLQNMCCLPDTQLGLEKKAQMNQYRYVVSGCDWGGSDYSIVNRTKVSFTVHVILGVTADRNIDILWMQQYSGMAYHDIARRIAEDHKRFHGNVLASDAGVGFTYNTFLREAGYIRPDKHIILRYTGPNTKLFSRGMDGSTMYNEYTLNKTESITSLFEAIKRVNEDGSPNPRVRCYAWMEAQKHLMEFLNVYRNLSETDGGAQRFTYRRHGSKADDTLHAINFAFVACRVLLGEPLIEDPHLKQQIHALLSSAYSAGPSGNPWAGISG